MQNVFEVNGGSLSGVLEAGESIQLLPIPEKFTRDMFVVFKENPLSKANASIKICKGIPGDQISINSETKEISVNGTKMCVPFENDAQVLCWKDWLKFSSKVPEGYLFLMGTQPDAIDSRRRGYISREQVIGIAQKVTLNTSNGTT